MSIEPEKCYQMIISRLEVTSSTSLVRLCQFMRKNNVYYYIFVGFDLSMANR